MISRTPRRKSFPIMLAVLLVGLVAAGAPRTAAQDVPRAQPDPPPPNRGVPAALASADVRAPFVQTIPGTLVTIEMVPVGDLWWSRTEITWDAYDVLVFGLDQHAAPAAAPRVNGADGAANEEVRGPDAVLRPTKPHIVTDRGFGHAGYPAMSMSARGAQAFCEWLSALSGRRYRLPTEAEWEAACRAGQPADAASAPDASAPDAAPAPWASGSDPAQVPLSAWHRENSDRKTHPVGTRLPSAAGLHDLHGNVAEWCTAADGSFVLKGGSYRDPIKALRIDARQVPSPAWNQSDPNLPRSIWWLADAPFAGFRIVCEGEAAAGSAPATPAR